MRNKTYARVLTIAGSDSGGGAGIQADLKTFSALGCYGMSAITALTAQNTQAVTGIFPVPPDFLGQQIDAVLQDIGVDAVKIGMLHSPEVIQVVAERLSRYQVRNIVLDPVMVAKSGDKLLRDDAIDALKRELIPLSAVITPNLPEASVLLGWSDAALIHAERPQLEAACRALADLGPQAVLLKGGHLASDQSGDLLYRITADEMHWFEAERIDTPNTHGTGCTLSSAIASYLAQGASIQQAVQQAKVYITSALRAGAAYQIGHGHGPAHHFYAFWE